MNASGTIYTHECTSPENGRTDGCHLRNLESSSTTQWSRINNYQRTEPHFLVASFFCCTFAPDLKKTYLSTNLGRSRPQHKQYERKTPKYRPIDHRRYRGARWYDPAARRHTNRPARRNTRDRPRSIWRSRYVCRQYLRN